MLGLLRLLSDVLLLSLRLHIGLHYGRLLLWRLCLHLLLHDLLLWLSSLRLEASTYSRLLGLLSLRRLLLLDLLLGVPTARILLLAGLLGTLQYLLWLAWLLLLLLGYLRVHLLLLGCLSTDSLLLLGLGLHWWLLRRLLGHLLHSCPRSLLRRWLRRRLLELLLLLSLGDAAGSIFLLPLLLLFVLGDALLDIALQVAAQMNRKLGQFEGHLVTLVSLSELLDDLDDAFGLLGGQTVDLSDQVVALLHCKRLLFEVWRGLGLN